MTIKEVIVSMANQFSYGQASKVTTTELTFNLITNTTPTILLFFAVIITAFQLSGNAIDCRTRDLDTRCWIDGTYLYRKHLTGTVGKDLINIGIGKSDLRGERIYQTYYQWVTPSLLFMALIFYLPQFLWHHWEGGAMDILLKHNDSPNTREDRWNAQRERLLSYLHEPKHYHRHYAIKYYTCEVIALFALIYNINVMSTVLDNFWIEFFPAISALVRHDLKGFLKESYILFPYQAMCQSFSSYYGEIGPSEAMCTLPQSVVNKNIFAFLYLWTIVLLIFSLFRIICVIAKLIYQYKKQRDFGFCFVIAIIKKRLHPILFEELFDPEKRSQLRSIEE